MSTRRSERAFFYREFRRTFHTTGALLPSGPFLATALTRFLRRPGATRQILEVGPGTGAVTLRIVQNLRPGDRLELVELNARFVDYLQQRFASDPRLLAAADRVAIHHKPVQELTDHGKYDVIISGLPLNNFSVGLVEELLATLLRLLKPGGVLSFFEYIAIRRARAMVSGPQERARLSGIGRSLRGLLSASEFRRDAVWWNVPPAWVHHVRLPEVAPPVGGQAGWPKAENGQAHF
ncbi:MAG: class I SAM-dependent methyltransferase [Planctomycetota bacterium]